MKSFSLEEIIAIVNGELIGNCKDLIFAPEQIENAVKGNVTFIGNSKYARFWEKSKASSRVVVASDQSGVQLSTNGLLA